LIASYELKFIAVVRKIFFLLLKILLILLSPCKVERNFLQKITNFRLILSGREVARNLF